MFEELKEINARPEPFEIYTADDLWQEEHTANQMLSYHLNEDIDAASRNPDFIDRSVDWLVSRFGLGKGKKVADFGCGPGLYTSRLAQKGVDVTGIDFSANSIRYAEETAKKEGLSIRYHVADYLKWETQDRFDLIIMIMCDFSALSPAQRNTLLKRFSACLAPGGSIVLDTYSLAAFEQQGESSMFAENLMSGFWAPHDYYGFLNTFKYEKEKVMLDKYTIVEPHRTRTVYNWLQYFSLDMIEREFEACGLKVSEKLSDVAGTPFDPESEEFAVIAVIA